MKVSPEAQGRASENTAADETSCGLSSHGHWQRLVLGIPLALQNHLTYNRPCGAMDAQETRGRYRCRSIQITSLW